MISTFPLTIGLAEPKGFPIYQGKRNTPPDAEFQATQQVMRVHHFCRDNSIFINGCYLIRGVAGAIAWKLLNEYLIHGRTDFNNRELRLDPSLKLPEIGDNLEVRLALLKRRLENHCPDLRMDKTARGRFRLAVLRPVKLHQS